VHLKCFTAVEIAFFADLYGMTDEAVLVASRTPGSIAARWRRRDLRRARAAEDLPRQGGCRSLSVVHRTAHRLGPVEHHDALRAHRNDRGARRSHAAHALQDDGRAQAFIPLAFHPDNNQMRKLPGPTASDSCACTRCHG
jgi:aminodeoxyfutalosine synthase